MRRHLIKIENQFYKLKLIGHKPYELRLNDRDYRVGDIVNYQDSSTQEIYSQEFVIVSVLYAYKGLEPNYCIFADKLIEVADEA